MNQTPMTAEYEHVMSQPLKEEEEPPLRAMIPDSQSSNPTTPPVFAGRQMSRGFMKQSSLDELGKDDGVCDNRNTYPSSNPNFLF
jgi:hypothetical protein